MTLLSENTKKAEDGIYKFLDQHAIEDWNTLDLIKQILSTYLIVDTESDAETVSCLYESALNSFGNHPDREKAEEAKRRAPAVKRVMKSSHIMNLFRIQNTNDIEASAVLTTKNNVTEKLQKEIEKQQSSNQQQQQSSSKQQGSKRDRESFTLRSDTHKKRQKASSQTSSRTSFKALSAEQALKCILESQDCKNNIVDFTKAISKKFKPAVPNIAIHYKFSLESAVTLEERRILLGLALCRNSDDEGELLNSLFKTSDVSENIKYLRTAINGLFDIWRSGRLNDDNNEGWLRSNLYSFIWDRAFLFDKTFYVKRAECYSAVIKKLKENNEDIAQQRVDFILRSNHDGSDYLTLEEKPTDGEAKYDYKKGKEMQRNMLTLWSNWLDSSTLVGELEAVTCQWQERKLIVFGTRMLPSGHFITYKKATAQISSISGCHAAAARLLQVVLSVKRLVTLNHMKLIAMLESIEKYSTDNLDLSVNTDQEYVTFYGSSQESASSSKENQEEPDYVPEALSKSKSVKHPDSIVSMGDWEKLIIDDVNQSL